MTVKTEENTNNSIRIYNDLLDKIIRLDYMPGERISENELCAVYHSTRHIVRGALSVLKEKKFVEIVPQSGTFVSLLELEKLKQVLFIREAIEQEGFFEIITQGINEKYLKALKMNLEKQKKEALSLNSVQSLFPLMNEFHLLMIEAIDKKEALGMLKDAHYHTLRWINMGKDVTASTEDQISIHETIVETIEKREWREGRNAIHNYIDGILQFCKKAMEKHPKYFA